MATNRTDTGTQPTTRPVVTVVQEATQDGDARWKAALDILIGEQDVIDYLAGTSRASKRAKRVHTRHGRKKTHR